LVLTPYSVVVRYQRFRRKQHVLLKRWYPNHKTTRRHNSEDTELCHGLNFKTQSSVSENDHFLFRSPFQDAISNQTSISP